MRDALTRLREQNEIGAMADEEMAGRGIGKSAEGR